MRSYLFGAVSVLSLLAATSASADDHNSEGWYLRGNAGYGIHTDIDVEGQIDSSLHGNGTQSEGNAGYSVGVGYDFGDHWRVEADIDSLNTSLGSISQTPNSSANLLTETAMLNAIYDFDGFGNFEPYVGAGIGAVRGKAKLFAADFADSAGGRVVNPTCVGSRAAPGGLECGVSDSDLGLGFQLLAGAGYKLSDNLTWDTHATYLKGSDLKLSGQQANVNTGNTAFTDTVVGGIGALALVTGLRYTFGGSKSPTAPVVSTPAPTPTFECWDGNMVFNSGQCLPKPEPVVEVVPQPEPIRQTQTCWDGSIMDISATCPAQPAPEPLPQTYACWDGSVVYDLATCPVQAPVVQQTNLNLCGESSVAIFNVPANKTPKQMPRLGTMPEFGDSHGLTPSQFYDKLNARYNDNATDKAYLNYLFKSMGYSNGWSDAQPYMFSEEVLPVGTRGLLGLGKQHHYEYSILPTNDRDRQAFRIQSANGSVVHFMKTCGNYMYACE